MKSLKRRIAAIVLVSILVVVGLATAVTLSVVGALDSRSPFDPIGEQMFNLSRLLERLPAEDLGRFVNLPQPSALMVEEMPTRMLNKSLQERGSSARVMVIRNSEQREQSIYLSLDGKAWMAQRFPGPPHIREIAFILCGWLFLIIAGAGAIAIAMANAVTRPYAMLEAAIASVGAEGIIPPVEERGKGQARAAAAALNRLSARLKSTMESRMRLVAAAGHDLRTPMTRMWLRTEFLPEEERAAWVNDLRELDRIADSAIHLVREEAGGVDREIIPLHELVAGTVDELAETGLPVALASAEAVFVSAGPLALTRAVRNVLINAATHGGGCSVRVGSDAGMASLTVEDQGPGIPADILDRVFEPFFQVDPARQRATPGVGLGLAIAKEIIERFGGDITIENAPTGGLRQVLRLPAMDGDAQS